MNQCTGMGPNVWYSHKHGRFYCNMKHPSCNGLDLIECFRMQIDLLAHMKTAHDITLQPKLIIEQSLCAITDDD